VSKNNTGSLPLRGILPVINIDTDLQSPQTSSTVRKCQISTEFDSRIIHCRHTPYSYTRNVHYMPNRNVKAYLSLHQLQFCSLSFIQRAQTSS